MNKWKQSWLYKKIVAFIPRHVGNRWVLGCFEGLRKIQRLTSKSGSIHLAENMRALSAHQKRIEGSQGYVEDQRNYSDVKYGKVTMKYAGCEIFAVYNALVSLKVRQGLNLARLIEGFERDGMVLSGRFGTSPKALKDYFDRLGYKTWMTRDCSEFDEIEGQADALILTMYNNRDNIMHQVHTVHISKTEGQLIAHNVYGDGTLIGPYANMAELISHIRDGKAKAIALIGIGRRS